MRAASATATTPPAASALLSETAEPPPPVFGAPVGAAPPLAGAGAGALAGAAADAAGVAAAAALLLLSSDLLDFPDELSIDIPAGIPLDALAAGAAAAALEDPELDEVGRVTATVLPPEDDATEDDAAEVEAAVGKLVAELLSGPAAAVAVGVGLSVAAGAVAAVGVSFCDQRPISDKTPARTAIAMIAPTTQDVLFG